MTRRVIDLSVPIETGHFRWTVERRLLKSHDTPGSYTQATWIGWPIHGFSHMDAGRHFQPGGQTTSDIPLDRCIGSAVVLDLTEAQENAPIPTELIERAGADLREGDIALLHTGWDRRASISEPRFWDTAPWMAAEGCRFLRSRGIKAVGFDFPQDRCIRDFVTGARKPALEENTTHVELLLHGITMMEYLCNFGAISRPRVEFVALPLSIPDCDGAPVRAIAIES
ncbi:cyclase family protein [Psychromarinibacter sp. C21-152]|uniref:Cyclase family protein n=1 Tax=Psychromarinibacter sediminicola TaxID=3033385 RepID=A0AAE3NNW5_9RHOB|nr:cyclase family protein [Psychromarinibacter sediminicola]MDF0599721.1 cyclase family protein [Psychromarinibacter sediminicola]